MSQFAISFSREISRDFGNPMAEMNSLENSEQFNMIDSYYDAVADVEKGYIESLKIANPERIGIPRWCFLQSHQKT